MAKLAPIYTDHGETYHADTCQPLVQALKQGKVVLEASARGSYPGRRLGRNDLPGLKSVGFWDAAIEQDWGLEWHRNEGIEITYLESGKVGFALKEKNYILHAGDLTITRPWQPHRVGNPDVSACRLHWVILDVGVRRPNQAWKWPSWVVLSERDMRELTRMLQHNEQPVWHVPAEIGRCFQKIGAAVIKNHENQNISTLTVYLNELYLLVLHMLRESRISLNPSLSGTRRTVELFLRDLNENPESLAQPWTLPMMAEHCGIGLTAFVRHCKQLTNMTPVQCLNHYRVQAAAKLLRDKQKFNVTDVAFECGFHSSQYFATVFRQFMGCSPREFREKMGSPK